MSFVHGHGRDTTWVRSHHRAPHRPEDEQLELPADGDPDGADDAVIPTPREAPDDLACTDDLAGPGDQLSPAGEPASGGARAGRG